MPIVEPLEFQLPPAPQQFGQRWYRWIDTSRESPEDICVLDKAPLIRASSYLVKPHSIVTVRAVPAMKKTFAETDK